MKDSRGDPGHLLQLMQGTLNGWFRPLCGLRNLVGLPFSYMRSGRFTRITLRRVRRQEEGLDAIAASFEETSLRGALETQKSARNSRVAVQGTSRFTVQGLDCEKSDARLRRLVCAASTADLLARAERRLIMPGLYKAVAEMV